jgi:hypothetical protein
MAHFRHAKSKRKRAKKKLWQWRYKDLEKTPSIFYKSVVSERLAFPRLLLVGKYGQLEWSFKDYGG